MSAVTLTAATPGPSEANGDVCEGCTGSGACDVCDGYGQSIDQHECPACDGQGVCPDCYGTED